MDNDYLLIKPHHFLDYLYDLAVGERHNEENVYHSNNGLMCRKFMDGETKKIKFTPFVDDICSPCIKLINFKCTDTFDDATTLYYGTRYKNEFNYQLDIKLNAALPDIFSFDKVFDTLDLLLLLKDNLKNEIIDFYLWHRENRNENTFIGIGKAIEIYSKR